MKRNRKFYDMLVGALLAVLVMQLCLPAAAALSQKTIEVATGVNIYVNDKKIDPKDANGNPVEVFIYNGTTYLPIRAVGNALGLPIQWDGATQSAYVGSHESNKPSVWMKDMDYYTGGKNSFTIKDMKDNFGNSRPNSFTYTSWGEVTVDRTYLLNGQYSAISGTFFTAYEARTWKAKSTLEIYGDNNLLYRAEVEADTMPIDFHVDLTGVLQLRIVTEIGNSAAGIADFGLWT